MVMAIRAINFFLVPKFFDNDYRLNDRIFCAKIKSSRNRVNLCMLNYAPTSLKKNIQSITQYTRFLPLDGTLIFKQIELKTKNSTKRQLSCRLVEFCCHLVEFLVLNQFT